MDFKKNPKINESRFKTMFRNLGFIIAISLTITAFEWKFEEVKIDILVPPGDENWVAIVIEPTTHDLPERPKPMSNSQDVMEVPNDTEIPPEVIDVVKPIETKSDEQGLEILIGDVVVEDIAMPPVIFAEVDAVPVIGVNEWYKKVNKYCQNNYKERDRRINKKGKVYVSFIVEKNGSLSNVKVKIGVSKSLDKLAVDAVRSSGDWVPAKQGGRRVRLIKNLPIFFN